MLVTLASQQLIKCYTPYKNPASTGRMEDKINGEGESSDQEKC